jgi:hypothetical protein
MDDVTHETESALCNMNKYPFRTNEHVFEAYNEIKSHRKYKPQQKP